MKQTTDPTRKTYTGLTDAYDFFNERLFAGRLPACLFRLAGKGTFDVAFVDPPYDSELRTRGLDRSGAPQVLVSPWTAPSPALPAHGSLRRHRAFLLSVGRERISPKGKRLTLLKAGPYNVIPDEVRPSWER